MEEFKNYDNKTPYFKLIGNKNFCRVVDIYDGDTLTVVLNIFDSHYYKFNVRLSGIDTCEMRSVNDETKEKAIQARNKLFQLITTENYNNYNFSTKKELKHFFDNNIFLIWIECEDFDKYGRLLANLYKNKNDTLSFSQILINEKLAYSYNGDRKLTEYEQLLTLEDNHDDD